MISVIVPVYNVEQYLDRCLTSLVRQTYSDLQIILVDDGSTDGCAGMCDAWAKKDPRILTVHQSNQGLSEARNAGLRLATGRYLAFVDSDDFVEPNMYRYMVEAMERTGSDIAACGRYRFDNETGNRRIMHTCRKESVFSTEEAIGALLCGGEMEETVWDKVFKAELFRGISFPKGEINEDIAVTPEVFAGADRIVGVDRAFYYYCINSGSITHRPFGEKKLVVAKHISDTSEYIRGHFPSLEQSLRVFRARYSISQLFAFYQKKELKEQYKEYYRFYRQNIRESWWAYIRSGQVPLKRKIECTMMVCGVYGLYSQMKKKTR